MMFLNNNIIIIIVVAPSKFHSTLNQSPLADSDAEDKRDHLAEVLKGGREGKGTRKKKRTENLQWLLQGENSN